MGIVLVYLLLRCGFLTLFSVLSQLLAQHFDWFYDAFDKMTKDGRETQWRQIAEHEKPEMVALPDNMDDKYVIIVIYLILSS